MERIRGNNTLRVIHSFPVWLPQTQTWMYNQVRYLPEDIEPHIVCEKTENLDQFGLPHIHSLDTASRWRFHWDMRLRMHGVRQHLGFLVRQSRHLKAAIIHSHFGNIGWSDMKAAQRAGVRHVVTFYGQDVNYLPSVDQRWKVRYGELFVHVDTVLCEGRHMARCVARLGCPEEKIIVQHLGVRVDQIPFKIRQWNPSTPLRVLIASTFREKKGIPFGLEALGRLQGDVPLEITIIGDASSAPGSMEEKAKIMSVIEKYDLMPRTRMLGYQPHSVFFEEALNHHVFLSPSITAKDGDTEGGAPVSIIEMAASGMPVISTTHCDIPEIIHHGRTGLLSPEGDVSGLVSHLKWSVKHWDRWAEMVQAGRRHIEANFNAITQGGRLANIYREIAGK